MSKRKFWLLGGTSCAVLWIAATLGPTPGVEHAPTAPEREAEVSISYAAKATSDTMALSEREAMRARMNELEQKLANVTGTPSRSAPKAPAALPTRQDVEQSEFLQQSRVVSRLESEPIDEAWRTASESKLLQALKTSPEPDAVVLGASCRSNHCRVQLDLHAVAPEDLQLAVSRLMSAVPWNSQAFYQPDSLDPNAHTGALFISRDGRETALQSGQLAAK